MWARIKKFFNDSETIFYARLQAFIGFVVIAVTYIDPSLIVPVLGDWAPYFLLANGIATEVLRRRRSDL
ncbi:MAG: hypothetical protein AB7O39_03100 [Flavobacteriaceae bacterium]